MCIFSTLIIWEIRLQILDFILPLLSPKIFFPPVPLPPLIFSYLQVLIHGFLWWEFVLDSSFPRSGVSNQLSSFSILQPLIFKKQKTPLIKKIQGLQALHGATLCGIRASPSRWCSFASSNFVPSIHFNSFFFIGFSISIVLWFSVV